MIEDGAMPWDVDRVFVAFGMPMGPFAMSDLAGLDVGYRVRKEREKQRPSNERYSEIADKIVEMDRLGQKTGAGFYKYDGRNGSPDPDIEAAHPGCLQEQGYRAARVHRRGDREAPHLLDDQRGREDPGRRDRHSPSDIDVVYVNGYGFPAWRGGPMAYADSVGLANILADIDAFQARDGQGWHAADLIRRLVAEGKSFSDYQKEAKVEP